MHASLLNGPDPGLTKGVTPSIILGINNVRNRSSKLSIAIGLTAL